MDTEKELEYIRKCIESILKDVRWNAAVSYCRSDGHVLEAIAAALKETLDLKYEPT